MISHIVTIILLLLTLLTLGDGTDAVSDSIELRRAWINETLNLTFSEGLLILPDLNRLVPTSRSIVQGLCEPLSHTSDVTRSSCCSSPRMRHIYNVLFEADKMVLFGGRNQTHMNSLPKRLQGVRSYKMQQEIFFNRDIVTRDEEFNPAIQCKTYFEGTLHIIKRSTTHNVYHSVSDNVLVTISTILSDAYLRPDMLYKPRKLLIDYEPQLFRQNIPTERHSVAEMGTPHMRLLREMMSDGVIPLKELSGTCYRRVVWDTEPHTNYLVTLQTLRRKMGIFARLFGAKLLSRYLQRENPSWLSQTLFSKRELAKDKKPLISGTGKPLRVVIYTRGSSGQGRTIQNEALLGSELMARGAEVMHCCDFGKVGLEQQLYIASQADVIMGLHGAALVHGIFMNPGTISIELKTLYAYESILFFIIADARQGVHGQIDIRKYFTNSPGHRPIDLPLVNRVMVALDAALYMQANMTCAPSAKAIKSLSPEMKGDIVVPAQCSLPAFSHALGPHANVTKDVCANMILSKVFLDIFSTKNIWDLHCNACK